jgi:hypothetical protein
LPNIAQNASVSGRGEIGRDGAPKSPFLLTKYNHVDDAGVLQEGYFTSFACEDEERAWQRHAKSRTSCSGAAHGAEYGESIREHRSHENGTGTNRPDWSQSRFHAGCHTFRHSFAAHVLRLNGFAVPSPVDRYWSAALRQRSEAEARSAPQA